ncbi:MAG: hypothetical protein K2N58_01735 [Treponemataceae bacterium]|nr:hypothetical protein [Treponemataceae bacterium]
MKKKALCLFTAYFLIAFAQTRNLFALEEIVPIGNDDGNPVLLAKASKTKEKKSKRKDKEPEVQNDAPITKIVIDSEKKGSYFSGISDKILSLAEDGSPEALLDLLAKIRKSSVEYEENERVLIFIATEIMKVVWASQNFQGEVPQVPSRNAYVGAIESARSGIYDTSTGNSDFLLCVLPSLVLCSSNLRSDFYAKSESDLREALSFKKDSTLANYLLGLLCMKSGRVEDALSNFRLAAEKSNAFEINFNLAAALNDLGRYEESQSITDRLIVAEPSNLGLLKLLAQISYNRADYSSAERYAMLVLTQNPSDLEMVLFRAKVFVKTGEYLKAASLLDVYAKSNLNSKEYFLLRSRVQKEWNKNISAAISTIEKAISLYPDDSEVLLYAAELAGDGGRSVGGRSSEELSQQVLKSDSENPLALSFLIKNFIDSEKWRDAYNSSKSLMAKDSSNETIGTHVKICLALGYDEEAWNNASALYEKNPSDEVAIQTYVEAMVRTGRTALASRFINTALGSASNSMKSFLYYQRSFLANGESARLSDLRSAVMANPRNSDALFRMYEIYFEKQDYRKAQYYLRQVIALNPNNANYLRLNSDLDKLIR